MGSGSSRVDRGLVRAGLCLFLTALSASAQSTGVFREVFTGISGSTVAQLTNAAVYPYGPTSEQVGGGLETPENQAETFGQRLRALVTAPTSGLYRFGIASDDASTLYLATNASPTGMARIAWVNNWTGSRVFTTETNQQSGLIALTSGQVCYLEVQHKEGGGADNLCVRWILPDGSTNTPIPSARLAPYGRPLPVFIRQPTSTTVLVGNSVTFAATLQRTLNASLQWRRDGTNLPAATATNLVLGPLGLADGGHTFACVASNAHGVTTSQVALLNVISDTVPPVIAGTQYLGDGRILLTFSEPLTAAGVSNLTHYTLAGPGGLVQAALLADGYRVLLVATGLAYDASFTLAVSGLTDQAVAPVTMLPATQVVMQAYPPAPLGLVHGAVEPAGPSSRRTGFAITEIMYRPAARSDGRELEYIELFNGAEWAEDLGGFRLAGEVDYTIPSNTVLGARQYLVIAPVPADVQAIYGITNLIGGFAGRLGNGGGAVQLRGRVGEVLLAAAYDPEPPFPAAADGAGHALVLARPSRGESDPAAWAASAQPGGSPGAAEPVLTNTWAGLVINEVLAHTDDPVEDFIELMNVGTGALDAAGCWLSDDVGTNRYALPPGTVLPPRGFVRFTQSQLGFSLDAAGEVVVLREPAGLRVLDALRFGPQANGRPLGRYPDGGPTFRALSAATPAAPNATRYQPALVLNELMYHPVTEDGRDEYVEVHNRTAAPVDLTGWRLRGGISFSFPTGATIAAGGYVVVAADAAHLLATHPALPPALVHGNFAGALADGGERVALDQPEEIASTNGLGQWVTNLVHIVEDEVTYGDGGRWGVWADGGGSSLERVDPAADSGQATTWADSDESGKSAWTTLAVTGVLEHGHASFAASQLHLLLLGAGECLVDNVEVIPQGSTNAVTNAAFAASAAGWIAQGTHEDSGWAATAGEGGGGALWLRATGRGDTGVNRVRTTLRTAPAALSTAILRARVRWLKGHPELLLRLRGNWLEATGNILTATDLGSPGAANSRALAHAGPAIDLVTHDPVLPATGQAVTVYARVQDADGVAAPLLRYRQDPDLFTNTVEMTRRGGGFFSAVIPAQAAGTLVAYHIEAADLRVGEQATTRFPADAPAREALVRWGDPVPAGMLGAYRLWITQATAARWAAREKNSNRPLDGTFVYGSARAIYNVECLYSGSPFHAASFNGPTGTVQCDYTVVCPSDDRCLGATDFVLNNTSGDSTTLRQRLAFWFARELGLPYLHRRPIYLYLNGNLRGGVVSEDVQQPAGDHVEEFFPDDDRGPLHKIEDWFEFQDDGTSFSYTTATLENFLSGGTKRTARYRWNWRPRSVRGTANDFADLFSLVDAANAATPNPYETVLPAALDTHQWMRTLALERMTGNNDSYGYSRGKNMYAYKPAGAPWQLLAWDLDFSFGAGSDGTSTTLDGSHDPVVAVFKNQPRFARQWFAVMQQLVDGPMVSTVVEPWIDVRYTAQQANGIGVSGRAALKSWIQDRRTYIAGVLATSAVPYAVSGPSNLTTNANFITLGGTAPVGVDRLTVNGIVYVPRWTTLTTWQLDLPLAEGTNNLLFAGVDAQGLAVTNPPVLVQVVSTATPEPASGRVLINEVMYNAATSGASYVELCNAATSTTYDLSRWIMPAAGLTVPDGLLLAPGACAVFARDAAGFAAAYGAGLPVAGVLTGELSNAGEWLQLIRPGVTTNEDAVIAEVEYDELTPWPAAANGSGFSLQLVDTAQDPRRVANWEAAAPSPGVTNAVRRGLAPFASVWLNEVVASNALGAVDRLGEHEPWVELYNAGTDAVALVGYALTDQTNDLLRWTFPTNAMIAAGGFVVVWLDGEPAESATNEWHASFRAPSATGFVALVSPGTGTPMLVDYLRPGALPVDRAFGSITPGSPCGRRQLGSATPGLTNDTASPPLTLLFNEWMADNAAAVADPDDGGFKDWFELYNPTDFPMPLDGARLTDNPAQPARFVVPSGYVVPPHGFFRVWADDEDDENTPTNPALHVNFKLSKSGEQLLLFASDGSPVDAISFGDQVTDRAEGRFPDGEGWPFALTAPTPGAANAYDLNHPPLLDPLPASLVFRGSTLSLAASAVDTDAPPQTLTFSLAVAPSGAVLGAASGLFSWTPADDGPAAVELVAVRVTDNGTPPLSSTQTFAVAVYPRPVFEARAPEAAAESYQFWTIAGHHYQVEYKEDLLAGEWQALGSPFVGEGGWHAVEEGGLPGDVQRFYRVLEWP